MTFHMRAGKVVQRRRDGVAAFTRPPRNSNVIKEKSYTGWTLGSYKPFRVVLLLLASTRLSFFTRAGVFTLSLFRLFEHSPARRTRLLGAYQLRGSMLLPAAFGVASVAEYEKTAKIDSHRKILPENFVKQNSYNIWM